MAFRMACGARGEAEKVATGARHKSGIAGVMWGRMASRAAVGFRRCSLEARQLAD
jgi:hypothetical protein